jgi:TolA-binding protein
LALLISTSGLGAEAAEQAAYAALQAAVGAEAHHRVIDLGRDFGRRFPHSAHRSQVRFWLAEALYAKRRYADAMAAYHTLLQSDPSFPQTAAVLYHLGLSAQASQHLRVAMEAFQRYLQLEPMPQATKPWSVRWQVMRHLAALAFEQGHCHEALPLYEQLLQAPSAALPTAMVLLRLGQCAFGLQQIELAQSYYQRVLEEALPGEMALLARYHLGVTALAQDQTEIAQAHFATLIRDPSHRDIAAQAHRALAWMDYRQGNMEAAARALQHEALLAAPSAVDTRLAQAYEQLRLGRERDAIPLLLEARTWVRETDEAQWLNWMLARAYAGAGDTARALHSMQELIRDFPDSPHRAEAHRWQAELLMQQRDHTAALAAYRDALELIRTDAGAERLLRDLLALDVGPQALPEAIAVLQRWLHTFPLSPRRAEVQLRLGALLTRQGALTRAAAVYRGLLDPALPQPLQRRARLQLAGVLLNRGQEPQALELYEAFLRETPAQDEDSQARFWRAWLLQKQGDYAASNADWQVVLQRLPAGEPRGEILWRLGDNYVRLQQYEKAVAYLQQVVDQYASAPYARMATWQLQHCAMALKQYRRALHASPVFLQQDPLGVFHAAKRFDEGERLFKAKRYTKARLLFRQIAAQRTPLADDAAFLLAESYAAEGKRHDAWQQYRRVTQLYGRSPFTALAFYRQGVMLQEAKRLPEAADALQQAVALTAEVQLRFQARRRLGTIYIALQEADKARTVLHRLAHDDMDPAVTAEERLRIGLMLQQVEAYESSLMLLQQASQLAETEPLRAEARFWMADTQQLQGDMQAALTLFRQVATQFPQQPAWALTALFRAAELYEALQQYADAISLYRKVVAVNPADQRGRFAAERIRVLQQTGSAPEQGE